MPKKKTEPLRQKTVLALKGKDEWKEWLDGLAEHVGLPVAILVEQALREKAERSAYPKPPKRY